MNIETVELIINGYVEDVEVHFSFYPGSEQIIGRVPELSDLGEPEVYEIEKALIDGVTEIDIDDELDTRIIEALEAKRWIYEQNSIL
jgi:hypothetical protein